MRLSPTAICHQFWCCRGQSQLNFRLLSITPCCEDLDSALEMAFLDAAETCCQFGGDTVITYCCPRRPPVLSVWNTQSQLTCSISLCRHNHGYALIDNLILRILHSVYPIEPTSERDNTPVFFTHFHLLCYHSDLRSFCVNKTNVRELKTHCCIQYMLQ